jgi:D-aminopeptidase
MADRGARTADRARHLGWVPDSSLETGLNNAITDVKGVLVGHTTLIKGDPGSLVIGDGPVRTGVTAIRPHPGNIFTERVAAGVHVLNGFGKTTGLEQIRELGILETPILLTNTLNVWRCADALVEWMLLENPGIGIKTGTVNPVVGECNDGWLNDIQGRHVFREDVFAALESANQDQVWEGNVGAGTGTMCYQFKGGIGTASRILPDDSGGFLVGALLQANFGTRAQLMLKGRPVGRWMADWPGTKDQYESVGRLDDGSCVMIIATDAPLSSRQLGRLARRAPLGLARTGFTSNPGSGDYVIAFSTSNGRSRGAADPAKPVRLIIDESPIFASLIQAVVEVVEESVLNALVAATTMEGRDGHIAHAIPIDLVQEYITNP